jgi:hypothetical protein
MCDALCLFVPLSMSVSVSVSMSVYVSERVCSRRRASTCSPIAKRGRWGGQGQGVHGLRGLGFRVRAAIVADHVLQRGA